MMNFCFNVPTTVYFGKGQLEKLGPAMRPYGNKALLVYGGGSIKRIGLYDEVLRLLDAQGIQVLELGGVEPNPRVESVRQGVAICKDQKVDMVLAVGGGSAIDCAKAVAAGARYAGDVWELVLDHSKVKEALPVFTVLTIAATGSEMNGGGVITNFATNEKRSVSSDLLKPKVSIMDPTYTFTVPRSQTAAGTADIMSHTLEGFFTQLDDVFFQRQVAIGVLKTCVKYGPVALEHPEDYEARANLMWASSWAINGLIKLGTKEVWCVHPMEHELSAFYDITHGVGLAIITPHWMRHVLSEQTAGRFAEYGVSVWGINPDLPALEIANRAIDATANFFQNVLGLPARLSEVGVGEDKLEVMARKAAAMGLDRSYVPLGWEDVLAIYRASM